MPKLPIKYENGLIYQLVCNYHSINESYYGSTTNFKQRKNEHKSRCNNINSEAHDSIKYQIIRNNGGWDNWSMVLVKYYPCKDKRELEREERRICDLDPNNINHIKPYITDTERNENKKTYQNKRYLKHSNLILEKSKIYYNNNKKLISKKQKLYRTNNKSLILQKGQKEINCNCGLVLHQNSIYKHKKSEKHFDFMTYSALLWLQSF